MPSTGRVRLSREARRAQLIELGVRMLAGRRFDELSTDDLAAAAGISSGLLFHYFPTKHDFHVAVARAAASDLVARVRPDPRADPATQLRGSLEAYLGHLAEHHGAYVALVRGAAAGVDPELGAVYEDTRAVFTGWLIAILEALRGPVTPALALAVRGWQAFVEEIVLVWMEGSELSRAELLDLLEQSFPRLLDLGAPAAAAAPRRRG
jgi:AcrR family transcriptional regulator